MIETFEAYICAIEDTITNKLPDILKQALDLPPGLDSVKDSAMDQIEALSIYNKGTAMAALATNAKLISSIPTAIENAAKALKDALEEAKNAIERLKNEMDNFGKLGKQCADKKLKEPVDCYKDAFPAKAK